MLKISQELLDFGKLEEEIVRKYWSPLNEREAMKLNQEIIGIKEEKKKIRYLIDTREYEFEIPESIRYVSLGILDNQWVLYAKDFDGNALVIHPATTTHSQLTAAEQLEAGVTPGLVRLSLGLENINDIKADLEVGFKAAKG